MPRFQSIEGLRGYLAWSVVASHIAYLANGPAMLRHLGTKAVIVFIVISSFTISHAILTKREPYRIYITKRFFRLFPLFAVTCLAGFFTSELLASANLPDQEFAAIMQAVAASDHDWLPWHILAHATMLHAAIPNNLLPWSEYAFNMPAWYVSLQWQFYLFAPLIIAAIRRHPIGLWFVATLSASLLWRIGPFTQSGALPFVMPYVAIGMLASLADLPVPKGIWLLENRLATYAGSRAYAVYLTHWPVVCIVVHLIPAQDILAIVAVGIPSIVIIAELAYRCIERPGIALGRYLTTR